MIVIENLVKNYGYFNALDDISINVVKGSIHGVIGDFGAGKTTLAKIAAGVLMPDSGKVKFNGVDLHKYPTKVKGNIGYLPELFGVYEDLKVEEYIDFYLGIQKIPKEERVNISDQLLELLELSDKKEDYVGTLSKGRKKWLCLARALIHNPEILILDEPASELDHIEWVQMTEILKTLNEMGKTILITSVNIPQAARLCSDYSLLDHGRITLCGKLDDVTRIARNR